MKNEEPETLEEKRDFDFWFIYVVICILAGFGTLYAVVTL